MGWPHSRHGPDWAVRLCVRGPRGRVVSGVPQLPMEPVSPRLSLGSCYDLQAGQNVPRPCHCSGEATRRGQRTGMSRKAPMAVLWVECVWTQGKPRPWHAQSPSFSGLVTPLGKKPKMTPFQAVWCEGAGMGSGGGWELASTRGFGLHQSKLSGGEGGWAGMVRKALGSLPPPRSVSSL